MKSDFNCPQSDFILVVTAGLNSFFTHILQFTLYSPKFVALWGNTMRTDLATAEAMPDEDARDAQLRAKGVEVATKAAVARGLWQQLKDYIMGSFPENLVEIMLNAAGQRLYRNAAGENWSLTQQMLASATRLITANLAALTDSNEMPATFPTEFEAAVTAFRLSLSEYEDMKTNNMVVAQERLDALNDIHARFMPMMTAGQKIFKDNPAVRTQFVFIDVLARVGGHGLAGCNGKVTDSASNLSISGALIKLVLNDDPEMEYSGTTNDDGEYEVNCPSGTYTITVSVTGYTPHIMEDMVIEVGTMRRLNVKLLPVDGE